MWQDHQHANYTHHDPKAVGVSFATCTIPLMECTEFCDDPHCVTTDCYTTCCEEPECFVDFDFKYNNTACSYPCVDACPVPCPDHLAQCMDCVPLPHEYADYAPYHPPVEYPKVAVPANSPVQEIFNEIAAECEHFIKRSECDECNHKVLSSPPSLTIIDDLVKQEYEEKRLRNKEAAAKYRNKLKSRFSVLQDEEKELSTRNAELKELATSLESQVQQYRKALLENAQYWRKTIGIID